MPVCCELVAHRVEASMFLALITDGAVANVDTRQMTVTSKYPLNEITTRIERCDNV